MPLERLVSPRGRGGPRTPARRGRGHQPSQLQVLQTERMRPRAWEVSPRACVRRGDPVPQESFFFFNWTIIALGILGGPSGKDAPPPPGPGQCRRCKGLIPVSGRSPGVGNSNPLQYSCLAWRISWTEEPVRLQSIGLQRVDLTEVDLAGTHAIALQCCVRFCCTMK